VQFSASISYSCILRHCHLSGTCVSYATVNLIKNFLKNARTLHFRAGFRAVNYCSHIMASPFKKTFAGSFKQRKVERRKVQGPGPSTMSLFVLYMNHNDCALPGSCTCTGCLFIFESSLNSYLNLQDCHLKSTAVSHSSARSLYYGLQSPVSG